MLTVFLTQKTIVTSKSGSPFFYPDICIKSVLNSRDFHECIMVLISSSLIFTKAFAYVEVFNKLNDKIPQYQTE